MVGQVEWMTESMVEVGQVEWMVVVWVFEEGSCGCVCYVPPGRIESNGLFLAFYFGNWEFILLNTC